MRTKPFALKCSPSRLMDYPSDTLNGSLRFYFFILVNGVSFCL